MEASPLRGSTSLSRWVSSNGFDMQLEAAGLGVHTHIERTWREERRLRPWYWDSNQAGHEDLEMKEIPKITVKSGLAIMEASRHPRSSASDERPTARDADIGSQLANFSPKRGATGSRK
jgi:hypothetical protein